MHLQLPALQMKKHVYCEKPLTYNIAECRRIREEAKRAGVATQMGTQIHAGSNYRRVVELVQSRAIGEVTECHVWVGRAWGRQSKDDATKHRDIVFAQERPATSGDSLGIEVGIFGLAGSPGEPSIMSISRTKWYRWWILAMAMSDLGSHWVDLLSEWNRHRRSFP